MSHPAYWTAEPRTEIEIFEAPEIATAVMSRKDFPMSQMSELFDEGFEALFPALAAKGLAPAGPAFSLHYRIPDDKADLEVGVPVTPAFEGELGGDGGLVFVPSILPGGKVAAISHIGSYEGLGEAWGNFMEKLAQQGANPAIPFWEIYVTEPYPGIDPKTLRTDLYTLLA